MARKTSASLRVQDFSSWNFILFLTLAFILLVVLANAMNGTAQDIRTKAGLTCPRPEIPRPEGCPGGWTFLRDTANGCPIFVCEAK